MDTKPLNIKSLNTKSLNAKLLNTQGLTKLARDFELTTCLLHQRGTLRFVYEEEPGISEKPLPINSCTKSVLSALITIAMEKGLFPAPDAKVSEFFPELLIPRPQQGKRTLARKQSLTIAHLLDMSAGFQWTEFGGNNSFPKMTRSPNWIAFVLEQPFATEPGAKWTYSSGVSQLLAGILQQVIPMPITDFAEQHLFTPLNIENYEWECDPQGVCTGGYGMQLAAMDLLKFGLLYLQQGIWDGHSILPAHLIERAVSPAIEVQPPDRGFYGWHWWVDAVTVPNQSPHDERGESKTQSSRTLPYFYARGYGGQFTFVVPSCDAVVVTMRKRNKKGYFPHDLFRKHIAPML